MDKLILLVGPSGSGKTTIAKELEMMGYNIIHSYTTREPREPNEWGHTFIPEIKNKNITCAKTSNYYTLAINGEYEVTECFKKKLVPYIYYNSEVFAHRELYGEHYWATKDQYQGKGTSIYTVCPNGVRQVQENVKDAEVITIFLMADEEIRYDRIRNRHFYNTEYEEGVSVDCLYNESKKIARNRIKADRKVFSQCKCDYVVDANRAIDKVVLDVLEIIEQF